MRELKRSQCLFFDCTSRCNTCKNTNFDDELTGVRYNKQVSEKKQESDEHYQEFRKKKKRRQKHAETEFIKSGSVRHDISLKDDRGDDETNDHLSALVEEAGDHKKTLGRSRRLAATEHSWIAEGTSAGVSSFGRKDNSQDESLSMTIRDRIRSRILKAKSEAASQEDPQSTQSNTNSFPRRRHVSSTKKTDSEGSVSKEDLETENAFQAHLKAKENWRRVTGHAVGKAVPSVVAYDFFTRSWDHESTPTIQARTELLSSTSEVDVDNPNLGEGDAELEVNYDEEAVLFYKTYANMDGQWDMVYDSKAKYTSHKERHHLEKQFLFVPSKSPASLLDKLGSEQEPYNPEDDGLYVGQKPQVARQCANIIENRLITQKETQWFDDDGTIRSLPNPFITGRYHQNWNEDEASQLTVYRKAVVASEHERIIGDQLSSSWYQLDVDISAIVFEHHPLFSREHVLCSRLTLLCKTYSELVQSNTINHLTIKLKALRAAVNNLKQSLEVGSSDDDGDKVKRLEFYQDQVRSVRQLRDSKMEKLKDMEQSIIQLWQEIKALRREQGYNSTSLKLKIHKESTDKQTDEQDLHRELAEELEEEYNVYRRNYDRLMEEYVKKKEEWQKWSKSKKKRKSKTKSPGKSQTLSEEISRSSHGPDGSQSAEIEEAVPEKPSRPVSPEPFDEKAVMKRLREKALRTGRTPGNPKLLLEFTQDGSVTASEQCPRSEQQRRLLVSKRRIIVKVLFNNKEACKTSERPISQNFIVTVGQIFNLRIIHWPESLCLQIHETNGINHSLLAEVYLPLPEAGITLSNLNTSEYDFSSEQYVAPKHEGVGSGVKFSGSDVLDASPWLLTGGVLRCQVGWGMDENGHILGPSPKEGAGALQTAFRHRFGAKGLADIKRLKEWAEQSQLDPNDPENVAVFQALQKFTGNSLMDEGIESGGYFRLNPLLAEFNFATEEEILQNSRFQLLMLRSKGVPEFRNYHMIPILEKEIPPELLQTKAKPESPMKAKEGLELQRERASRMLKRLWEAMMMQFQMTGTQRTLDDIIVEDQVPSIGSLGINLLYITRHRRPLYPIRKERKKVTGQNVTSTDVKIIIQIRHAMNVPVRIDTDLLKNAKRKQSLNFGESQVRPFVEVMFQRETSQTDVAEGPQPTWNQELHLPFRAPDDDYTPSGLQKVQDKIYLNLFDEVTVDLLEDERDRETTIHQRLERHWLGSLKIPFSTLYLNSKIEGTFCLNVPPVLLGYDYETKPWKIGRTPDEEVCRTYLSVFLTVEPSLQLPEAIKEQCISEESENLMWKADQWLKNLTSRYPGRQFKTVAVDMTGRWVFVTRYIRAIEPPAELLNDDEGSVEGKLARFVSLVPTRSDSIVFPGICDIWTTCDHFLHSLIGDEEEHAILLCNYFLYLKKRAYLLLGEAIPEGPTAYVLTVESFSEILVWNATTGECFNAKDSHSPLQKVGCLINSDNIWANIQKNDHPSQMNFDLSKKTDWRPFFTSSFRNPGLKSVQPEQLIYTPPDNDYIKQMQSKIETILKESIMKWRRRFRTSWNRFCMQALRKTLPKLEKKGRKTSNVDSLEELEEIFVSYKMSGFPLSMPYTDINAIVEAVFATGVHQVETKNTEFALAVYLHPYPCNVLAVWVYIATLTRIR